MVPLHFVQLASEFGTGRVQTHFLILFEFVAILRCMTHNSLGAVASFSRLATVDVLVAASLCAGLSGVSTYFARGWRTPGALVVAMTMALHRLARIAFPFGATVFALALGIASIIHGPATSAAFIEAFPGTTSASFFKIKSNIFWIL